MVELLGVDYERASRNAAIPSSMAASLVRFLTHPWVASHER